VVSIKVRGEMRDERIRASALEISAPKLRTLDNDMVQLNFAGRLATPEGVEQLKEILARYPGPTEVFLVTPQSSKNFRLGPNFKVNVDSAAGELLTVFGGGVFKTEVPNQGGSAQS
jgi:hypothetical protein